MKIKSIAFCVGMSLSLFSGCAGVMPSHFLENYDQLSPGKHLERVMISPDLSLKNGLTIEMQKPIAERMEDNEIFPLARAQSYLAEVLEKRLKEVAALKVVTAKNESLPTDGRRLVLQTAITQLNPGSRLTRWFASELGAGHSYVQVEGKLIDSSTQKVLLQFADQRAGSAAGGFDITGGSGEQMLKADMDGIAKALAETLRERI